MKNDDVKDSNNSIKSEELIAVEKTDDDYSDKSVKIYFYIK